MSELKTIIINIPEGVTINLVDRTIEVLGSLGSITREFSRALVTIQTEGNEIRVKALGSKRKESAIVGTISSHINNMIKGVTKGFTYKLKIVYSHFPISVKIRGREVSIENFIGERSPRIAKIVGDVKVVLEDDDVLVQGLNIEEVSQTSANIEQSTRVKKKDPRKFLDGIYFYEKTEGIMN